MSNLSGIFSTRTRRTITATLSALLLVAAALPVGAAGPPGNNGTVKIHSGADNGEPTPEIRNEPHVSCPFHVHFFFADVEQSGEWSIVGQAPTAGNAGTSGSYATTGGTFVTDAIDDLGPGHYKLSWQGSPTTREKHKTFWVVDGPCGEGGEGDEGGGIQG